MGFADKLTVDGVAPDVGLTESQPLPGSGRTDTRNPTNAPSLAIAMFTGLADAPDCTAANAAVLGEMESTDADATISVTGNVSGLPADGVMTTCPVYVPGVKPPGFTVADTLPGVVPLLGVADNHPFRPFVVLVATV